MRKDSVLKDRNSVPWQDIAYAGTAIVRIHTARYHSAPHTPSICASHYHFHVPFSLPHSALTSTCPSSSTTFPLSHSRPSPFFAHLTSSSVFSPPFSHFFTSSSVKPAARSR